MTDDTAAPTSPIVLYGALRSGTTLLRLILDAHPAMVCPGERDFMLDHLNTHGGALTLDAEGLAMARIFQDSGLAVPGETDGRAAFADLLAQQDPGPGKVLVLVLHRRLDLLLDLMPDVRIVHFLRDPRDVARSSIGLGWAGNTWYGVDHWIKTEAQWDRSAGSMAPEQVFDLRYEDLVSDPEANLARLCAFIGLEYDPAMLSFPDTSTYSAVDPKLGEQWKRKQSPREIALTEVKVADLLTRRGYAHSGHPVTAPGPAERAGLWVQNKTSVWGAAFRRYGVTDPILVRAAARLGQPHLARKAQLRMNERARKTLK